MQSIQEELIKLYTAYSGQAPLQIAKLSPAGSNRQYFRLEGTTSLIGVFGKAVEENQAFVYMADYFRQRNIPVPKVLAQSKDDKCYLQEDLGDTLLYDAIEQGRNTGLFNEKEKMLLLKTIKMLPTIQMEGANMDFSHCYPQSEFNKRTVLWDLNYFKYCFLKATGIEFQEDLLEDDFQKMAELLIHDNIQAFMYRDFQSRNVMIKDDEPWFIDFQGGRKGPLYYDVASFLWQAKANYSDELRQELLDAYLNALQQYITVDRDKFHTRLQHFILFRHLQVLGCYGFRGYFEQKPHFLSSIPYALRNLNKLLKQSFAEYPYLCKVLQDIIDSHSITTMPEVGKGLLVSITSFSYKKGIPQDLSGNGGGYVFDCRAIHNPGRYDCYRSLTGLDKPVIDFLEEKGEIVTFLQHIYALVDSSVDKYLKRGFTNLSVSFGCTGGQHRSVYAAQHLAEHLHQKYNITIRLIHREQHIEQLFKPDSPTQN